MDAVLQDQGERLRKGRRSHSRGAYLFQSRDRRGGNRERRASLPCLDRVRHAGRIAFRRSSTSLRGRAKSRSTLRLDHQNMPDLKPLQAQIMAAIAAAEAAQDEATLEAVRVTLLGKKGLIAALLAGLGTMPPDERREHGVAGNLLKDKSTQVVAERSADLKEAALEARLKADIADVTLPVRPHGIEVGRIHPVSQVMDE